MSDPETTSIESLLRAHESLLAEIAGSGGFEIESGGKDEATLRTDSLDIRFGRERDNDLSGSLIILRDPPEGTEPCADSGLWARFIGIESECVVRDEHGRAQTPADEQIARELNLVARLSRELFADRTKTRDAAFYVEGYMMAYNDWASGQYDV